MNTKIRESKRIGSAGVDSSESDSSDRFAHSLNRLSAFTQRI